jgi:hypothetical protein
MTQAVTDYLAALTPETRAIVEALREVIGSAGDELTETIKWNAPNFAKAGVDRITLGLEHRVACGWFCTAASRFGRRTAFTLLTQIA